MAPDPEILTGAVLLDSHHGLGRSLSLGLSDAPVYEPHMRDRLGTTAHFCKVVVLIFPTPHRVRLGSKHQPYMALAGPSLEGIHGVHTGFNPK